MTAGHVTNLADWSVPAKRSSNGERMTSAKREIGTLSRIDWATITTAADSPITVAKFRTTRRSVRVEGRYPEMSKPYLQEPSSDGFLKKDARLVLTRRT